MSVLEWIGKKFIFFKYFKSIFILRSLLNLSTVKFVEYVKIY